MSADVVARWTLLGYAAFGALVVLWRALRCPEGWRRWMLYAVDALYCRLCFHWRADRPCPFLEARPAIVIANHRSPLDPVFIWAGVTNRRPLECMTAREYFGIPGLQFILDAQRSIPVARDGKDMAATRTALQRLKEGRIIGIFPEGGINYEGTDLRPGNPGIAWLALQSGAPVYPVFIHNAPHAMSMLTPFWTFQRVFIRYGDPIDLSAYRGKRRTGELLQEVTNLMMNRLAELGGVKVREAAPVPADPPNVLPMRSA